ncbi:DNA polymerase epsilon catalytic subunit A, variant 2 [Stylosanthes scabra]|uniref:DNA polymerase epsilon catalytic subunit n=1 Tax=Stylosanthes scabra TaxID=79078 RepID=A0ABU6U2X2_9FABA|nr:DNA polymerase epsilon catalytic subunit A, variant 2 [Stylosanthes scabra]
MNGDGRRRDWRDNPRRSKKQKQICSAEEQLEAKLGFEVFSEGEKRLGWLLNFASSSYEDEETRKVYSCVDLYFVTQDGSSFKAKYRFRPYFYAATKNKMEMDVEAYLRRRYETQIADIKIVEKEDLDLKNHLSGLRKSYLKLSFDTVQQLMTVKSDLMHVVERNQAKSDAAEAYEFILTERREQKPQDFIDCITDLREYDVPYHVRFAIDNATMTLRFTCDPDIRSGQWYDVCVSSTGCVGDDIENLEYTPKPEFEGSFTVKNVPNEFELLKEWFADMQKKLGFQCDKNQGECRAKFACHLDCFAWVKRDSYLPQGSQGLKAVTKAKLGYDPMEVNPEDMVRFAKEKPQTMASYSVSDAAYKANVICPNKHQSDPEKFYNNHLLESETYIGGHVECLESGVFRSDIPTNFTLKSSAYEQLINNLDRDLEYAIRVEGKMDLESVSNYDEVKTAIMEKLSKLRDAPIREECPLIYHLDVAAMYPNIILTNRLQPPSIVSDEVCTACDFNRPGKTCLRKLEWVWRGETFMAKKSDYYHIKKQIESDFVDGANARLSKSFLDLPKAYKRVLDKPVTELRKAGICMRENPFYVDTVRSFRDRRYEYKGLNKVWKGKLSEAKASGNPMKIQEAQV